MHIHVELPPQLLDPVFSFFPPRNDCTKNQQLIDNMPKDLNRPWEDPMPDAGERLFTMELRGISVSG